MIDPTITIEDITLVFNQGIDRAIDQLGRMLKQGFDSIDERFAEVDRRFEAMDRRFESMDLRMSRMERRLDRAVYQPELAAAVARIDVLETR